MLTILLTIQIFIVLFLIAIILLQKTGTDSLAGLAGGGHGMLSNRTASNVFSKLTIGFAVAFMLNSLIIAKVSVNSSRETFWETPGQLAEGPEHAASAEAEETSKEVTNDAKQPSKQQVDSKKNKEKAAKIKKEIQSNGGITLPDVPKVLE